MRWLLAPILALSWLTGAPAAAWATDPEIWFNPHTPLDYMNMWTDTAPWQQAASKVQVLDIVHWWLNTVTDQQILAMTDFAKRRDMKIDFEIEAVTRYATEACGHTEGYTAPDTLTNEATILKRLNVKVDMMTMDEPVWFGHYNPDPNGCHLSVPDLVARVASNLSGVIALYPNIQVYEIEPIPAVTNFPDWRDTMRQFRTGLNKAIGKQIRSVELDVNWSSPSWIPALRDIYRFAHQQNMGLGVIYDGTAEARSDAQWMAGAAEHFEYIEGTLGIKLDQAIFATWQPYPAYNMPETSPTAQTWLIDRYVRQRTLMIAQFVGQGVHGRLTTEGGKAIANATINGYVPGVDFSIPLPATVIQDIVPANAAQALIGVRLNTECNCAGVNDVLLGSVQYQESQAGSASYTFQYPPVPSTFAGSIVDGERVGGTKVTRVITTPTQSFFPNSNTFPVTPGAQYSFTVPSSTIGGSGWYGNVFLLFLDSNGSGFYRANVVPDAGKRLMSTAVTAADGTFQLPKLPRVGPGSAPVTVEFAGDDTYRSVTWSPLH